MSAIIESTCEICCQEKQDCDCCCENCGDSLFGQQYYETDRDGFLFCEDCLELAKG